MVLAICADGFLAVCYLLGIDLGCFVYADQPATCFHILAVVLPMLFTRPALWNILRTALYEGVFACCVVTFKTPEVAAMDLMDAVLFGLMACVISTYYVRALTDNVVARCKLKVIAETDLNTQIPNRNAYENHMHEYPLRCANSLSCVYVDVNGLHELNNTKGHDAGDVMLKIVAQEMTKNFRPQGYLPHRRRRVRGLCGGHRPPPCPRDDADAGTGRRGPRLLRGCGLRHLQRRRHPDQSPHQTGRDPDV